MSSETSVIVINQDGLVHLDDCFRSLERFTPKATKLVLLDNGSKDDSIEYVRRKFPRVEIIANAKNEGFAGGYDLAIKASTSRYVVLLNNDTEVTEGWLEPLLQAVQPPDVAISGARLMSYQNHSVVDHAGGLINVGGGGIDVDKGLAKEPQSKKPHITGFGCGACVLVKRDVYLAVGGFWPDHIIYHEDVDLGWKAWLAGYRVLHVPNSVVYHKGGASMGQHETPKRIWLAQKNRLSNLICNAGPKLLVEGILVSLCFDLLRSLKWLLTGKFNNLVALWKANLSVMADAGRLLHRREKIQHGLRKKTDHELAQMGIFAGPLSSLRAYISR